VFSAFLITVFKTVITGIYSFNFNKDIEGESVSLLAVFYLYLNNIMAEDGKKSEIIREY